MYVGLLVSMYFVYPKYIELLLCYNNVYPNVKR